MGIRYVKAADAEVAVTVLADIEKEVLLRWPSDYSQRDFRSRVRDVCILLQLERPTEALRDEAI